MAKVKPKKKAMGCPIKPVDWEKVDKSLVAGSAGTEVAAALGIHPDTLYNRCLQEKKMTFSLYSAVKRQKGDDMLRAAQFKNAMRGNTTMQIWLGKVRLKQREFDVSDDKMKESLSELKEFIKIHKDKYQDDAAKSQANE